MDEKKKKPQTYRPNFGFRSIIPLQSIWIGRGKKAWLGITAMRVVIDEINRENGQREAREQVDHKPFCCHGRKIKGSECWKAGTLLFPTFNIFNGRSLVFLPSLDELYETVYATANQRDSRFWYGAKLREEGRDGNRKCWVGMWYIRAGERAHAPG